MSIAPGVVRAGIALILVALTGACLFGLWHLVVGGVINGNPRAGTFGLVLAGSTGVAIALIALAARRAGRA